MTTREEAARLCLSQPFAYEDYPFGEEWMIFRHGENEKIFAMVFERQGHIWMNLKAEPMRGDFWRQTFPSVVPAYHMNKRHWVSVILDDSISEDDIAMMIEESFRLTMPKRLHKAE